MASFYKQEKAGQCHDIPCYVTSFDVSVTRDAETGRVVYSVADGCNILTGCKMLSAVLRSAFSAHLEAENQTEDCGCCRSGKDIYLNIHSKVLEFDDNGVLTVGDVENPLVFTVTPPFKAG